MEVIKRNGKTEEFNADKISAAIDKAYYATHSERCDMCDILVSTVEEVLDGHDTTVDEIQRVVENVLMDAQLYDVARNYIQYRHDRDRERVTMPVEAISDYTTVAKYSQYQQTLGRREVYREIAARSCSMHQRRFPEFSREIRAAFDYVDNKRVLPSMRSMQFGGPAIDYNNVRAFNCSFTHINRLRVFGEIFWVLLSGSGVGYSVQFRHVSQLPSVLRVGKTVQHYRVEDTIEGWGDAVNELIRAYFVTGKLIEFDFSGIRDEGTPLKTSGGRAPGHLPLKRALELLRQILENAAGRQLRPVECYDMICHLADAVLAGGIRRSSCLCLFSIDDFEMMTCKAHGNYVPEGVPGRPAKNPQRGMSNNSGFCERGVVTREQFDRLISLAKDWGDPSFYWGDDPDVGTNPCGEIGMDPRFSKLGFGDDSINFNWKRYRDEFFWKGGGLFRRDPVTDLTTNDIDPQRAYGSAVGFSFCNLCEINGAVIGSVDDFFNAAEAATIIGTLQATLTDMPYLGPVTEAVVKRDALLGVGLTGILDNPKFCLDPDHLERAADWCMRTNEVWAKFLGINPAARVTTVKPGGTGPLVLGVASGSTAHHAPRYFRRITANPNERPAQYLKSLNPHMVEVKPNGDWCITFCVTAPEGAICLPELKDTDHMDMIFTLYEYWVRPGTRHGTLTHNVSCTIVVDDWDEVIEKAWDNRDRIAAMAFLPRMGDKMFPYAPREAVVSPADELKWVGLCENYVPIDWSLFIEEQDNTDLGGTVACGGGACEL